MIRRNPTLIPMSDLDVQDVRNLLAQKKAQAAQAAQSEAKGKGKERDMSTVTPAMLLGGQGHVAAEDLKRKREAMSKDERLGL